MTYAIVMSRPAAKQLHKLPASVQERIAHAISALADTPCPTGAVALQGLDDTFRIRVGDYRIAYTVLEEEVVILIVRVGHRREVYRNL